MTSPRKDVPGERHSLAIPADVAEFIRDFNAANRAHLDLWTRVHQARDAVRHAVHDRIAAQLRAQRASDSHLVVQAEYPHRRAPLPRQALIAALTIGLDAVACWFAAQALGGGQDQTLLWTLLFLAVLAAGEVVLDHYSDHGGRAWRLVAAALAAFVAGLGILRFEYLATVGTIGAGAALVGAALFTAATAGFLVLGYRALRAAERSSAWRARRWSRQADREAAAASNRVAWLLRERNRLADAYLSRIRVGLLERCSSLQLPQVEAALREHLIGRGVP